MDAETARPPKDEFDTMGALLVLVGAVSKCGETVEGAKKLRDQGKLLDADLAFGRARVWGCESVGGGGAVPREPGPGALTIDGTFLWRAEDPRGEGRSYRQEYRRLCEHE